MRASAGYRQPLSKAAALLATTVTAAASLLFVAAPPSSADTAPTGYTPHLITVSPTNDLTSTMDATGFTNNFGDIAFATIEKELRNLNNSSAPFQDACWYDTDVNTWIGSPSTPGNNNSYRSQTCFAVQSITYADDAAGKRIVVAPADAIKYPGNDSIIELSAPIGDNETAQDVINKHLVFRFAEPTLTTRFTYYLESGNPNGLTLAGAGMQKISDKDSHQRYTQLVAKANKDVSTYTANVTVSSSRSVTQSIGAYNSDAHAGNTHQVAGGDISTASNTIQRWSASTTDGGVSPNFLVRTQPKSDLTISASVANDKYFFTNDSSSETNRSFEKGGTPAYVRKIFTGTGLGNDARVGSGTAATAGNANGCTINGADANHFDCGATQTNELDARYDQTGLGKSTRVDNCTFGAASSGCGGAGGYSTIGRYRHMYYGAAGGCFKGLTDTSLLSVTNPSNSQYSTALAALRNDSLYNSGGNLFGRPAGRAGCLSPTNAADFAVGNYGSSNSYKVWFDHIENTSTQEEIYNKFISQIWINGEAVDVQLPQLCTDTPSGSNYITKAECEAIGQAYGNISSQTSADYSSWNTVTFYQNGSIYQNPRNRLLSTGGPVLGKKTFTSGPNAGTEVTVRLVNARVAGEFGSMIDDMSGNFDYSGYCLATTTTANTRTVYNTDGSVRTPGNDPLAFCGWGYNGNQKGLLWSTRYEVEIKNPQQVKTDVQAFYVNTANNRISAYGTSGTFGSNLAQSPAMETWSDPSTGPGQTNNDASKWASLCSNGELAQQYAGRDTERTTENYGCSYSYLRQQYSQIGSLTSNNGNAVVRFKVRNGYVPSNEGQLALTVTNSSSGSLTPTATSPAQISSLGDDSYAYFYFKSPNPGGISLTARSEQDFAHVPYTPAARLGRGTVNVVTPNLVPKNFSVAYLRPESGTLTEIADLPSTTGLNVVNNTTFTAPRPPATAGVLFKSWKLVWCADAGTTQCTKPAHKVNRTTTNTGVTDKNGDPIYTVAETDGGEYPTIAPGEHIDLRDIRALTDSKGDPTANKEHNHLALVAADTQAAGQPLLYGYTQDLYNSAEPSKPIINKLLALFRGTPGLTARVKSDAEWTNPSYRADVTFNNKTYKFNESLSTRSATLNSDGAFPVYLMLAPDGLAQLTVVRNYQGIPHASGILTDATSAAIDPWRAGTESGEPATFTELANPTTDGDSKNYPAVTEGSYILDSAAKADSYFIAPLTDWTCTDTDHPDTTIDVTDAAHSSATRTARGTVALGAETKATCTTTYSSTGIAALAMGVADPSGTAPTLGNAHLTFTALSEDGTALTALDSRNKLISSTNGYSAQLPAATTVSSANAVVVRPGIGLQITADGVPSGYMYRIQGLKDGVNVGDANFDDDANWQDVATTDGAAVVATIPGHRFLAYRLYVYPLPDFTLPLTGGHPADLVILAGLLLTVTGAAVGFGMRKHRMT